MTKSLLKNWPDLVQAFKPARHGGAKAPLHTNLAEFCKSAAQSRFRRMPLISSLFTTAFAGVTAILVLTMTSSCMPMPTACEVMTLDKAEQYKVLSRYGRSYFRTDCESPVPQEILIEGQGYSVYIYLQARIPAEAFIGVRPLRSDRFMLTGESLREDSPESAFRDRVTHFVRLNELPNRIMTFQVADRETGKTYSHSFKSGSVTCTCKTYSGP